MPTLETVATTSQTLAERISNGRIPVPEALRYSMILADALRKIHDSGHAHGAVTPSCVAITRTGLELLPADGGTGLTAYTAPEVIEGKLADSRSDIFAFGAILYEMLTGRVAFQGEDPSVLTSAILHSAPPSSGSPAVDRLVAGCLAKDPGARWSRLQKLLLELKLLSVAVRRAESPTPPARQQVESAIRAEIRQIELRLAGRLEQCEQTIVAVNTRLDGIEQLQLATAERAEQCEQGIVAVNSRLDVLEQSHDAATERTERLEESIASARQDAATLHGNVSEELAAVDRSLKAQSASIESLRTAMSQTDDLVERVVEALESLQSVVLEHSDERQESLG
jgi:methyl-accepting chemotaxis protein